MSDDANDVTKALAAFGAPSIRYHSFGQGQIRPSSIVLPRRPGQVPAVEDVAADPVLQHEPVAAPEPLPVMAAAPVTVARPEPPRPALPPRQVEAAQTTPTPTVAPPPRPLAEWAAPVTPAPTSSPVPRPAVAPMPPIRAATPAPAPAMQPAAPAPSTVVPPLFPAPSQNAAPPPAVAKQVHTVIPTPLPAPQPRPVPALVAAAPLGQDSGTAERTVAAAASSRALRDVFEFLAMGPSRVGVAASHN